MNKQEVIDKIEDKRTDCDDTIWGGAYDEAIDDALAIVRQLDELGKVTVPQYVADWYEENKDDFEWHLYNLCIDFHKRELPDDLLEWFANNNNKPIVTLAKMNLFGYEVEKEKQYVVVIPDDGRNGFIQLWKNREGKLLFNFEDKIRYGKVHLLTEKEIKQKDKRLWQFAKEVNNNDD